MSMKEGQHEWNSFTREKNTNELHASKWESSKIVALCVCLRYDAQANITAVDKHWWYVWQPTKTHKSKNCKFLVVNIRKLCICFDETAWYKPTQNDLNIAISVETTLKLCYRALLCITFHFESVILHLTTHTVAINCWTRIMSAVFCATFSSSLRLQFCLYEIHFLLFEVSSVSVRHYGNCVWHKIAQS